MSAMIKALQSTVVGTRVSLLEDLKVSGRAKARSDSHSTAESVSPQDSKQALFKTDMCKNFVATGHCRFGRGCVFAHSKKELRAPHNPMFKTRVCHNFAKGFCSYGSRCQYLHERPLEQFRAQLEAFERRYEATQASQANRLSLLAIMEVEPAGPRLEVFRAIQN